ncbi:MAG: acyloxyacyl hydrolase [Marinicaulis sp.]|nr:acyloxyacyl hydrolase [Marinicaulis sp.]
MKAVLYPLLFTLFAAFTSPAYAQGAIDEIRAGIFAQSCCGPGSNKEEGVALNGEVIFNSPRALTVLGSPRPVVGGTIATDGDATSLGYFGLEWKFDLAPKIFVAVGGGGAVHNGETKFDPLVDAPRVNNTLFLGCRAAIRMAGDLGYRIAPRVSASLHWSHISNAGLCQVNEGLDHLGVRLGFDF